VAGYYSATQQHNAAAPLADFCTAAYRIDGLCDLKIATGFGGVGLSAELVLTLLKDGSYRRHMEV
jgi:hypothetical protein